MFDYDVAVIGLGPAGSTFARLAADNMKVFALSRPVGEGGFSKPCGGLLSSDAQKALSRFDLTLPKDILVDPQIFSVRTIDLKSGLIRHYQRFYINLDRDRFDSWMASLIPSSADLVRGICRRIKRLEKGGFEIAYTDSEGEKRITARFVVGADGANSAVRKSLFPQKKFRSYVSIQQWFDEKNDSPFYSCIFDPDTSDSCSWSISKDGKFIFGGAFAAENCREMFELQKQKLSEKFGFKFGAPVKTEACIVLRPKTPADFCTGENGAFLIGEAAGFISPSSFEGVSWAINSARLLAQAIKSQNPNKSYHKLTGTIRLKLLLKRLKCPFMYHPLLRRWVMKSGLQTIEVTPTQRRPLE